MWKDCSMLHSFSWLSLWGVESRDGLRSLLWISLWLLMWTTLVQRGEVGLWSETQGLGTPSAVCQLLVVWRNNQLPVSFLWTQNQRREIILQSGRCFLFPPGWKCEGCRWLQTQQESPGSAASFKSGNLLCLSRLLGHKLFFLVAAISETFLKE